MSKRAKELMRQMTPVIIEALANRHNMTGADEKIEALIDAELRKAVEAAVDHVLQDWLCYDDETSKEHREYNEAHRGHLIEGGRIASLLADAQGKICAALSYAED